MRARVGNVLRRQAAEVLRRGSEARRRSTRAWMRLSTRAAHGRGAEQRRPSSQLSLPSSRVRASGKTHTVTTGPQRPCGGARGLRPARSTGRRLPLGPQRLVPAGCRLRSWAREASASRTCSRRSRRCPSLSPCRWRARTPAAVGGTTSVLPRRSPEGHAVSLRSARRGAARRQPAGGERRISVVAGPAAVLVDALEACSHEGLSGVVLLVEEPELFLRPQASGRPVPAAARVCGRWEPGRLLQARAGLPERRPAGRARARRARPRGPDDDRPARPATRGRELPRPQRVRRRAQRALPRAGRAPRRGATEKLVFPTSSVRSGTTPTARRSRSSSAAASRTSRYSRGSGRRCTSPTGGARPATPTRQAADPGLAGERGDCRGRGRRADRRARPRLRRRRGLQAHSHKPGHAWHAFADADGAQIPAPLAEAVTRVLALARD